MSGFVVAAVDGSDNSVQALEWSVAEAGLRGDALLIVYCLHMPIATAPFANTVAFPQVDELREYADGVLSAVAATAQKMAPALEVRTELAIRPPSAGLLEASTDASLIVVGTRGLSELGAVFLGSVSTRVAAHSSCPTVVVPAEGDGLDHRGPVVVGVDGSDHAAAALRFAVHEATLRGTGLVVVHGRGTTDQLHLPEDVERTEQSQAEALVAEVLERADLGDTEVTSRIVSAEPADAVLEADDGAALTVIGSRGRGGFRGMLLGSVSQSVLHRAERPVAVVRAEQEAQ